MTDLKTLAEGVGVADVVDAMMQTYSHRAHIIDLDSPNPERLLIGPALTVSFLPVRSDFMDRKKHTIGPAIYRAIGNRNPKDAVLVMASNGYRDASLGGGTGFSRLEYMGFSGVLTDGRLRDYEELASYGFATYCRGETVRMGGNEVQPYLSDVPISVGGVTVQPGDVVFARGSTAVVMPGDEAEAILRKGRAVMEKMDSMKDALKSEDRAAVLSQGSAAL